MPQEKSDIFRDILIQSLLVTGQGHGLLHIEIFYHFIESTLTREG